LTFVGILATFIVVSNYMQVKNIKDEFRVEVKNAKKEYEKAENKIEVTTQVLQKRKKSWKKKYLPLRRGRNDTHTAFGI
jgi:predicted Holliday junction resolvase-like endonuclease